MRKLFVSVLLSIPCLLINATAAPLDTFLQTLSENTLYSDFVITISEGTSQPVNYPGTITMRGDLFALEMFDMEAAFDGKTLYVYSAATDELTLSMPTEQELMEANPFLYARALSQVCSITEQPTGTNLTITLTPKDQTAGIQRFTLTLRQEKQQGVSLWLPQQITIKEGKQQTTVRLTNPTYTSDIPSFTITKPDAFLNDLR
ncbi:MAG: outer membrane lipoprotein carrier protein LolA [Paludibacteraceae bacterium]